MVWLDFTDAGLRPDYQRGDVCTSRPLGPDDLALTAALSARLREHVCGAPTVLVPFGLGFHVDHRIVRTAGLALAACLQGACGKLPAFYFYEDLPYAAAHGLETLERWVSSFALAEGLRLEAHYIRFPGLLEHKAGAARCYRSQAGNVVAKRIVEHARRLGTFADGAERVWHIRFSAAREDLAMRLDEHCGDVGRDTVEPEQDLAAPDDDVAPSSCG
jgi:hypothetical protein